VVGFRRALGWDDEDLDGFVSPSTIYVSLDEVCRILLSKWAGGRERLLPYGLEEFAFVIE
jgi:hypothetical protein